MTQAQLIRSALFEYIVVNSDEQGNTMLDCAELAVKFGVSKEVISYALNVLIDKPSTNLVPGKYQNSIYVTASYLNGCSYVVLEKYQKFTRLVSHIHWAYENLKNNNDETLDNHNFQGNDEEKSCNDDNSISNSIYNNISIRDNTLIGDNKRGVGEKEEPTTKVDYQQIVKIFNSCCPTLPKVQVLNDKRKMGVRQRVIELTKAYPNHDYLQIITRLCQKVHSSDFLSGRGGQWKASFDWLFCCKGNYLKVIEGNYDNNSSQPTDRDAERQMVLAQRQRESTAKAIADQEARSKLTKEEIWRAGKEAQEKHKEQIARNRAQMKAQNQQEYEELMKQYNEGKITL